MTPDLDIYRAAAILVERHVETAPVTASMQAGDGLHADGCHA